MWKSRATPLDLALPFCETSLFDGTRKRRLRVAPEECFRTRFSAIPGVDYLTGDFCPGRAMVRLDVTRLEFADESFDIVICNQVLEHVNEDFKAMQQIHRVLRSGGWAILQVPIKGDSTFEDDLIVDPDERRRLFGQYDHVRSYGRDYAERLRDAGFRVEVIPYAKQLGKRDATRYGLDWNEDVYLCKKQVRTDA